MADTANRRAKLYRMVTDAHICPFGLKSRDLLLRNGYEVDDHPLRTRQETDAFMREHGVDTTPQTFIGGRRIGGYDDLRTFFGDPPPDPNEKTYTPVIAIFAAAFVMALAALWGSGTAFSPIGLLEWFIAFSMCLLAVQKLRDLEGFTNRFITYDLLGMRMVRYGYAYPFVEFIAGAGMIAGVLIALVAPAALFIGAVGAASVYKAVYVDGRDLKCACVGGEGNVPLGFVSLTENLMMVLMGTWMLLKWLALGSA